jgi:hypothetical protein
LRAVFQNFANFGIVETKNKSNATNIKAFLGGEQMAQIRHIMTKKGSEIVIFR